MLRDAVALFRGLPWSQLFAEDISNNKSDQADTALAPLSQRTHWAKPGEVDIFFSHSWSDNATTKYAALSLWATRFEEKEGREPILWLEYAAAT